MLTPVLGRDGLGGIDPTRHGITQPQQLIYSAKVNRDKLSCYYKFCRCYCSQNVVQRTFLDVYANSVHLNVPEAACCCCSKDRATIWFYDNPDLGNVVAAGCCTPFPWCCNHLCGCCGDVVAFSRSTACCVCCDPPKGHYCAAFPILGCLLYLCFAEYVVGFEEGEAARVEDAVRRARMGEFNSPAHAAMGQPIGAPMQGHAFRQNDAPPPGSVNQDPAPKATAV